MNFLGNILRTLLLPVIIVGRLIFWLLLAVAALLLIKRLKRDAARAPGAAAPERAADKAVEDMVACARCGLLLPESESLREGGAHYCCEEHRRAR